MKKNKKSIFITGAASGIGKATAIYFAKMGWEVGLFDINEDGLENVGKRNWT
jgi:NADP-dependent 3-hydroxy acid dehydrogenase YdfG